jgi:hypothetical protein
MKINTRIPTGLRIYYDNEIQKHFQCLSVNQLPEAWSHLENAHILGQSFPIEHTYTHWLMLKFGFKIKDRKEILGQIPRLLVGGVKSFVGKIPVGNTGGANVSALRPMEIPEHLKEILEKYNPSHND